MDKKKLQNNYAIDILASYIDNLLETLESQHNLLIAGIKSNAVDTKNLKKITSIITKNSDSILFFRKQIFNLKKKAISQYQLQEISNIEQKLSNAIRLNARISELVEIKV